MEAVTLPNRALGGPPHWPNKPSFATLWAPLCKEPAVHQPYFSPRMRQLLGFLVLILLAAGSLSCDRLTRKPRRFGASCGQDQECESGVCYGGFCSSSCSGSDECGGGVCIEKHCQAPELDFDGDGLTNAYELKYAMKADNTDSDGDGVDDPTEIGPDLKNPKDQNGDGIPDAAQSNTADSDADCMVDAADKVKGADPLPDAAGLCDQGACKGKADQLTVICEPATAIAQPTGPCNGCVCQPKQTGAVPDWQKVESWCDSTDNDCDGQTDEGLSLAGQPLGGSCIASKGACALSGKTGKVICGSDKLVACSADTSSAAETCNGIDDDCDGFADENFTFASGSQSLAVGAACPDCGGAKALCPNGDVLATPTVTCNVAGDGAECSALPFDPGFTEMRQGAPEPRHSWSLTWWEAHRKFRLYGGEVATLTGSADLSEEWYIEVPEPAEASFWYRDTNLAPGARSGAALVDDPVLDGAWLVGGSAQGKMAHQVWFSAGPNDWVEAETSGSNGLAPLPPADQSPANPQSAKGFLMNDSGNRSLALIDSHFKKPKWAHMGDSASGWMDIQGGSDITTDVWCAAQSPDSRHVILAQTDGKWLRWSWDGAIVQANELNVTAAIAPRSGAQCVWAPDGKLYIAGGQVDGATAPLLKSAQVGLQGDQNELTFADVTAYSPSPEALGRAGGLAAWSASLNAVVIGGGNKLVGGKALHSPELWSWNTATGKVARLDQAVPRARVGHAMAWWPQKQALCLAGGLTAELPTTPGVPRLVPAADAWCLDDGQIWHRITSSGVLYAFGAGSIDVKGSRWVLAGGIKLLAGKEISTLPKLWTGQLLNGQFQVEPQLLPTNAVLGIPLPNALPGTGAVVSLTAANTPQVAAPAVALDGVRNRLIIFGGYDQTMETATYAALDLEKLQWTDLRAKILAAKPQAQIPQPRLGATAFYDAKKDLFAVVGGAVRFIDPATQKPTLGIDICGPDGIPGLPSIADAHQCLAIPYTPFNTAPTLVTADFTRTPIPAFENVKSPTADTALFWHWSPGPLFAPSLYDAAGMNAWWALPRPTTPQAKANADAALCASLDLGPAFSSPLELKHQLQVQFGLCGGLSAVSVVKAPVDPLPPALFDARTVYVDAKRQGWLVGGAEPSGALSVTVWRIGQSCNGP